MYSSCFLLVEGAWTRGAKLVAYQVLRVHICTALPQKEETTSGKNYEFSRLQRDMLRMNEYMSFDCHFANYGRPALVHSSIQLSEIPENVIGVAVKMLVQSSCSATGKPRSSGDCCSIKAQIN